MTNVNDIYNEYKNSSKVYVINEKLKFRIPDVLIKDYEDGKFNNYIESMTNIVNMLDTLQVKYKYDAHPVYYIYMLSIDNYKEILQIPSNFDNGTGGGRPIGCIDPDGFYKAYAVTDNFCRYSKEEYEEVFRKSNNIHEIVHLILNNKKFNPDRYFSEGLSEAVPLYVFDMEKDFTKHRDLITNLKEEDIIPINELYEQGDNNTFGDKKLNESYACTYRASYVSSYLAIASMIDHISKEYGIDKKKATSTFLDVAESTLGGNGMFLNSFASKIGMDFNTLYFGKEYQLEYINKVKEYSNNKTL